MRLEIDKEYGIKWSSPTSAGDHDGVDDTFMMFNNKAAVVLPRKGVECKTDPSILPPSVELCTQSATVRFIHWHARGVVKLVLRRFSSLAATDFPSAVYGIA